jgi:hypothetical protein
VNRHFEESKDHGRMEINAADIPSQRDSVTRRSGVEVGTQTETAIKSTTTYQNIVLQPNININTINFK